MLAQESWNLQAILLRRWSWLATLGVEVATGAVDRWRNPRSPCPTSFNCAASSGVVSRRMGYFFAFDRLRLAQVQANIGGEALEQSAGIARLGFMTFLLFL